MGHTRLGKIPTSKAWKDVVGTFASAGGGAGRASLKDEIPQIAAKTIEAAAGAIRAAQHDRGIGFVFFLFTQIALAARRPDMNEALRKVGLSLPANPSSIGLTVEIHRVLDDHFLNLNRKSDAAEIAQLALGETLAAYFRALPRDMFATAGDQLQRDLRELGTPRVFGDVSRQFFGTLIARLLNFYLSRIVRPGEGQNLINGVGDLTRFNAELRQHSYQRAAIVHEFATKWFSKTEFERGIDPRNAQRFVAYALQKIESELKRGAHGE